MSTGLIRCVLTSGRSLSAAALVLLAGCAADQSSTPGAGVPPPSKPAGTYAVVDGAEQPVPAVAMGDAATVARIIEEGTRRNRVMEHLTHISTVIGPRLTGSTNAEAANRWTRDQFASWGLWLPDFDGADGQSSTDPSMRGLWQWGTVAARFDRGPSTGKVVTARNPGSENPEYRTLRDMEFTTLAWTSGTAGPLRAPVVKMPESDEQFDAVSDRLKGAWVLVKPAQAGRRGVIGGASARLQLFADTRARWASGKDAPGDAPSDPDATRYEGTLVGGPFAADGMPFRLDVNLKDPKAVTGSIAIGEFRVGAIQNGAYNPETRELTFRAPSPRGNRDYTLVLNGDTLTGQTVLPDNGGTIKYDAKKVGAGSPKKGPTLEERVLKQGPAGWVLSSGNELVITGGAPGWSTLDVDKVSPDVIVTVRQSDYDCMNSRLADGLPVEAEFDLRHSFTRGPIPVYNTIAEIRGSELPDEVVIVSGHLDSWNGPMSQGTTDNGTGSAVTLEAARILAAAKARPKRTIRFILWTGEEQGLLGSVAYVKALKERGTLDKVSVVLVDDGGTNYEGGLPCVPSQVEYLAAATAPVNGRFYSATDAKYLDVNIRREEVFNQVMGSDHNSFNRERVPGFFWDEVGRADYNHTHHTQHDRLDQAIPEYLQQSATCAAVTAYNLACAPAMLPRPTDQEWPQRGGGGGGNGRRRDGQQPGQPPATPPANRSN